MPDPCTLAELLAAGADDDTAILAPDRPSLRYGPLRAHLRAAAGELGRLGIGREDRVAIVLPNGPEAATAFLAVALGATAAPLNPAYTREEFEFYLSDLAVTALILEAGSDSPARAAAVARGVAILELSHAPSDPAGLFSLRPFSLSGAEGATARAASLAEFDETALLLHTSGTTARPKIVPLTQANLAISACNTARSLRLTRSDRNLNFMPLFHIHGLIGSLLAGLAGGGSVYCSPGFNALRFFHWLDESQATWYTGVPAMHQVIAGRALRSPEIVARSKLRFARSASSALSVGVLGEFEGIMRVPIVEAYGMTEAAHQIASNPLPPGARKPGTVGLPAGPDIAIMDARGRLLPGGETGEIVIRGANVFPGYLDNPAANARSFTKGWFRTGDQGLIDPLGYVTITGRLKEIINRAGEKVAPKEVDDVLAQHPAVAHAVTFPVPHAKLGEEVACAIVFKHHMRATEAELRELASRRLAAFKVPSRFIFLDHLPRTPTGKVQRLGLAERLGLVDRGQERARA
ncbi:MAG: AMP-binding protein [Alphaproteobacteria bacterium]|nr:AMP-binding protein [Alphaproteobacteria bacterium]